MDKSHLFGFVLSCCRWQGKIKTRREKLVLNVKDEISRVLFGFVLGERGLVALLQKEVGYVEKVICILKILNFVALYVLTFIWINIMLWIWLTSLLAHIYSPSLSGISAAAGRCLGYESGILTVWGCQTGDVKLLYEQEGVAVQIEINNVCFQQCRKRDFLPNICKPWVIFLSWTDVCALRKW